MKRTLAILTGIFALATLAGSAATVVTAAANTVCSDLAGVPAYGNDVPGNLLVPNGNTCHLGGGTVVSGNVVIEPGGRFYTGTDNMDRSAIIKGNVASTRGEFKINHADVWGNVSANGGHINGAFVCASRVTGNITFQNWAVTAGGHPDGTALVGDNFSTDSAGGTNEGPNFDECKRPNAIGGNVVFSNNALARIEVSDNAIGGNLSVNNNRVHFEQIELENNRINVNLVCAGNTWDTGAPAVTDDGEPNQVGGHSTGQCD